MTEREMIHIRVLGCFFEQCTGQRLRTVTFDKFVDAGNPLFSGASANEDEEDVENEIVDGVIGEGIVERGAVDDEISPIGGLVRNASRDESCLVRNQFAKRCAGY